MSEWGGKREGSGRKPRDLGKTVVMRVPESRVEEIKLLISGDTKNIDCVHISKIKEILDKWDGLITPDRAKQPRWENAARLLNGLKAVLIKK